jgi:hypothetical protein
MFHIHDGSGVKGGEAMRGGGRREQSSKEEGSHDGKEENWSVRYRLQLEQYADRGHRGPDVCADRARRTLRVSTAGRLATTLANASRIVDTAQPLAALGMTLTDTWVERHVEARLATGARWVRLVAPADDRILERARVVERHLNERHGGRPFGEVKQTRGGSARRCLPPRPRS